MAAVRVTILASGSGGNATLVQAGGTRVLVDAGVGPEILRSRMQAVLGRAVGVDAIVTTHAHGDHVGKLIPCAKSFGARVYLTAATQRRLGPLDGVTTVVYSPSVPFDIGAIRIEPMPVPHDAPQVALVFAHRFARAGLVTDLGHVPPRLAEHLDGCQLVMLESNHDLGLLEAGPYPPFLKRRVASKLGHLSNEQAAELIRKLGPDVDEIVLMHLSQKNNLPRLALSRARAALDGRPVRLRTADQDAPLDLEVRWSTTVKRRVHEAQLALPL
jgi:phosphoribosyl 1,2-cyclic phosphodiesterase